MTDSVTECARPWREPWEREKSGGDSEFRGGDSPKGGEDSELRLVDEYRWDSWAEGDKLGRRG
jgi:hypothetical protein